VAAQALIGFGDATAGLDKPDAAERTLRQALQLSLQLHGEHDATSALAMNDLATQLFQEGKLVEAEALFRKALAIRLSLYGPRHVDVAQSMDNLASLEFNAGRYAEAEASWQKLLPIYIALYGDEHPEVGTLLNNLGRAQLIRGEVGAADVSMRRALAIDRKFRQPDDDDLILPLNSLGMIAIVQGDYAQAQTYLDEALKLAVAHKHWMLNQVLGNQADLNERNGNPDAARSFLARARTQQTADYGADLSGSEHWRTAVLDLVEGALDRDAGQYKQAKDRLQNALAILTKRFGAQSLYTNRAETLLLDIATKSGDTAGVKANRTLLASNQLKR
jgi:Tfp pilus assembly protein PilF